jgi:hypothetical protein
MVLVSDVQIPPPPPLIFQSYQIVISFSGPCEIAPFFAGVTVPSNAMFLLQQLMKENIMPLTIPEAFCTAMRRSIN